MNLLQIWHKEPIDNVRGMNYVNGLIDEGFIKKTGGEEEKRTFKVTPKGAKFLKKYHTIRKFVDNFRL